MTPISKPSIVALIPARAGSKRVKNKNFRTLGGVSLVRRAIMEADASRIFSHIVLSSDIDHESSEWWVASVFTSFGRHDRKPEHATDAAPDFWWVEDLLKDVTADAFAILRPTSPFRTAETIRQAWRFFLDHQPADSLRAVRYVTEHPAKMWNLTLGSRMTPLMGFHHLRDPLVPWHSSPTQSIPIPLPVIQTGALEIAWTRTLTEQQSISGSAVLSYFMPSNEELDINTEDDWKEAERLMTHQPVEYLG